MNVTAPEIIRAWFLGLVGGLSSEGMRFVMEIALLVIVPLALCGTGYLLSVKSAAGQGTARQATPNRGVQISLFIIGSLAAICMPVDSINVYDSEQRLWICTFAFLVVAFGPALLGYLIVPDAAAQKNTIRNLYIVLLVLIAWEIIREAIL